MALGGGDDIAADTGQGSDVACVGYHVGTHRSCFVSRNEATRTTLGSHRPRQATVAAVMRTGVAAATAA